MPTLVAISQLGDVLRACGGDSDLAASRVAWAQVGVVSSEQLQRLGVGRGKVNHLLAHGGLHRVYRGVYLLGHAVPPPGALEVAGLLACRQRVAIGLESAAAWWGVAPSPAPEVHVIAHRDGPRSRERLHVHRSRTLVAADIVRHRGLPVTTPLRTIVDLAAAGAPRLERTVSAAHAAGLITPAALAAEVLARAGHEGVPLLRGLTAVEARGFTRSENERRMRALCRRARLPQPRTNATVCGWEVDFFWADARLVVEIDALVTHGARAQFERDRRKQADLVAAGYPVLRFTDVALVDAPLAVIAALAASLARAQAG